MWQVSGRKRGVLSVLVQEGRRPMALCLGVCFKFLTQSYGMAVWDTKRTRTVCEQETHLDPTGSSYHPRNTAPRHAHKRWKIYVLFLSLYPSLHREARKINRWVGRRQPRKQPPDVPGGVEREVKTGEQKK